jgi:hypothetical protein
VALDPRFVHDGRTWRLFPADAERLVAGGLIVLAEADETHPVYDLAEGHILMEVDDFLAPLDHDASKVAKREGAPPIFTGAPHGSGGGGH